MRRTGRMTRGSHVRAVVALSVLLAGPARAEEPPCDAADIAVATIPVPPQSATAYRRAELVGRAAAQAPGAGIVLLGDSLTELWPEALARETFGDGLLNLGVGSDRTQNVLWRLQDARYARLSPWTVFLMIGTNNLGYGDKACAILDGIRRIVDRIDALWHRPALVVVGTPPRGRKSAFRDDARTALNRAVAELLAGRGGAVLVEGADAALRCADDQCPTFLPDMVHLTPEGYAALGAAIRARRSPAPAP